MPIIVAFIDILGFSSYTEQDLVGAQLLLRHQESILRLKLDDGQSYPANSYADSSLAKLAEAHQVDSFKHFLPFSDSTFIVSENPDKFARQLSHFLTECIQLVGHVYDHADDPACPETVEITEYPFGKKHTERWYPPLWRGGLATGDLMPLTVTGINDGKQVIIPNLTGTAVVRAVRAEKAGKLRGPRLLCETGFEAIFSTDVQPYFLPVTNTISELLWPAFLFEQGNNPRVDMNHFHDLWHPAVGLWKSKRGQVSFEHYDEFLKLLVRSFLRWAEVVGCTNDALQMARRCIGADLSEDLIEEYLQ